MLRSRSRVTALLIVVGALSIAATAATGIEPGGPNPIPDHAFRPVSLPPVSDTSALSDASATDGQGAPGAVGAPAPSAASVAAGTPLELTELREPDLATPRP